MAGLGTHHSLADHESPSAACHACSDGRHWQCLLFDSHMHAVTHGDASLPSVHSQSEVLASVEYLDMVFVSTPLQHSFIG